MVRNRRLKRIEAVIERQQGTPLKDDDYRLFFGGQRRRGRGILGPMSSVKRTLKGLRYLWRKPLMGIIFREIDFGFGQ